MPNSHRVLAGEAEVVKCPSTRGTEKYNEYEVTWYKNNISTPIPIEERHRVHSNFEFLWFLPVSKDDSGTYIYVIQRTNSCFICNLTITVYELDSGHCFTNSLTYSPINIRGSATKLCCPRLDDFPIQNLLKEIRWYKDCQPFPANKYTRSEKCIIITYTLPEDEGHYTCQITYVHNGTQYKVSR
uniref:Ig-like domain-containing protein n=1 Tax=Latimeria chalumnae TaxID=7897 RepID=H3A9D5_LATCH